MDPLYSASWYRVAERRPELASEAGFHRHRVRGEPWFVLRNPSTGRTHRLAAPGYDLAARLDGQHTLQELWEAVVERHGDDAPTQDETIELLGLLHGAGWLRGDVTPDTEAVFREFDEERRKERRSRRNPISFRVPLFDPDRFLTRWSPWVAPLFGRLGAALVAALLVAAAITALRHAPELAAAGRGLFDPSGLVAMWFAYPLVKIVHELGHAFAVKRWGGSVHEIGIQFLVFMPVPYVDASASTVFPEKSRRMVVAGAGILVELVLASLASFVWLSVEPGVVRQAAYAVMMVGGISTLLFNGNPLLRFDGYYVFSDAIEIPNLAARSNAYFGAWTQRTLLGMRETALPPTAAGEAPWLVGYAVAAFLYQMAVMFGIAFYLAGQFFVIGVALALFSVGMRVVWPLAKHASWLLTDPSVGERRGRALLGAGGLVALVGTFLFVLPVPLHTRSHGITWLPSHSQVRAGGKGFVVETAAEAHSLVKRGDPLIRTRNPVQEAELQSLRARRREKAMGVTAARQEGRVEIEIAREELAQAEAALARAREQARADWILSPADGRFVPADGRSLIGRHVEQGEVLAFVVDLDEATIRVVVPQEDVAQIRDGTKAAWVRVAHDLGRALPSSILRQVPAAGHELPSAALGSYGGGPFAVDSSDPDGRRSLEPFFQFDLSVPKGSVRAVGQRAHVRFDHGAEPIGLRLLRSLRLLFLSQLGV